MMEPGERTFDLPAVPRRTRAAAVLGAEAPAATMGDDHLDAVMRQQLVVERIAVVAAIADQSGRKVRKKSRVKRRVRSRLRNVA